MARTRGAEAPAPAIEPVVANVKKHPLPSPADNPPRVIILPRDISPAARVVSLPNPRNVSQSPTRYIVCPETGICEITKTSAPSSLPRSWLLQQSSPSQVKDARLETDYDRSNFEMQVANGADLYIATPIDPLFLVLPALASQLDAERRLYRSSDDHFETLDSIKSDLPQILRWRGTRRLLDKRMAAACDVVEAGDELMYKLNDEKLLKEMLGKAQRMSASPLPRSMEEKFVSKTLEAPVMSLTSSNGPPKLVSAGSDSDSSKMDVSTPTESVSQSSLAESVASVSTAPTSILEGSGEDSHDELTAAMQASEEVTRLQRIHASFSFLCSRYLSPKLTARLKSLLENHSSVDFTPRTAYIAKLTELRQAATLSRSASDFSRKRARDEEAEDMRAEKRRKQEEEKRRKATESIGQRKMKKINTDGMKKLSSFFTKK